MDKLYLFAGCVYMYRNPEKIRDHAKWIAKRLGIRYHDSLLKLIKED